MRNKVVNLHAIQFQNISKSTSNISKNTSKFTSKHIHISKFTSETDQDEPNRGGAIGAPWAQRIEPGTVCAPAHSAPGGSVSSWRTMGVGPRPKGNTLARGYAGEYSPIPLGYVPGWPPNTRGLLEVLVPILTDFYRFFGLSWEVF